MAKFSKGIVITTSKHTREYLKPLLESIKNTKYKVIIFENDYIGLIPNNIEYTVEYYDEEDEKLRVYESIKNIVEYNNSNYQLQIGEETISINKSIAKKIIKLHESLNRKNKNKLEKMLNEDITSLTKVINFAIKQ